MEGRSVRLLSIRHLSSFCMERLVLSTTFSVTGVDSIKYDLAGRARRKVVTNVPTNHLSIHCTVRNGSFAVTTTFGSKARWPR